MNEPEAPPSREDTLVIAELSRDLHRPEGPDEGRSEKRDQILADFCEAAWPTLKGQCQ